MKFKYNVKTKDMELVTDTLMSFCTKCGKYIGSIEYVPGSETLYYTIQNPFCNPCFDTLKIKHKEPLVVDSSTPKSIKRRKVDVRQ